ncbi:hypothetical protein EUC41_15695 [Achromobacter denitrificans]|jgi:hypothetical protein|uniref:Uncharacterized protein n=1 Tax=Achromobacter denitrificans TaxID=32002 RepID=A0A3R9GUK0_ACHDE|nr:MULTISPECIES: hypothetical protein [Achromobacter]ASC64031.1 hypothetical protein B9P52_06885 [Achromobacter denitrificans]MBV2158260.1 hypothetical protein [Achromobacter denitrificans]MDF3848487.1 hypothetical protein [Achromobacter denitrificans]MDF3856955.1 hypothetical protein [Achromobacter denitrificans]MDF3940357.1 hypothetical protein [Achromobacter denitrificans]
MLKTAPDPNAAKADVAEKPVPPDPRKGTEVMPMPDQSSTLVAGMPRRGRAIAEPGEPGVITPEDDVLDTSYENRKG